MRSVVSLKKQRAADVGELLWEGAAASRIDVSDLNGVCSRSVRFPELRAAAAVVGRAGALAARVRELGRHDQDVVVVTFCA